MANIYKGALGLIGNTPLVELTHIEKAFNLEAKILAKLEYFNPSGSVQDDKKKRVQLSLSRHREIRVSDLQQSQQQRDTESSLYFQRQ